MEILFTPIEILQSGMEVLYFCNKKSILAAAVSQHSCKDAHF